MRRRLLAVAAALLAAAAPAAAQKPYALPESPAFSFLDTSPAAVTRPTTARALATSLLSGVGAGGQVRQGVALDVAPWSLVPGMTVTLEEYRTSRSKYILANTQLSLGTVRAAGDSADTDLGVGARVVLFDHADPMADSGFVNELRRRLVTGCALPDQPGQGAATVDCARRVTQEWRESWLNDQGHWNEASLAIAAAGGWRLLESRTDSVDAIGWAGWATGALPLGKGGQIVAQLRYDLGRPGDADGLSYGARAFYGSAGANAFVEVTGDNRGEDAPRADWTAGIEFRAGDNLWLSTGLGNRRQPGDTEDRTVVIADLRWELSSGPRFTRGN